jgi:hypothetical protein
MHLKMIMGQLEQQKLTYFFLLFGAIFLEAVSAMLGATEGAQPKKTENLKIKGGIRKNNIYFWASS